MNPPRWYISRRTLLKTAGCSVALPVLEAMIRPGARAAAGQAPRRFLAVMGQHYGYLGRIDPQLAALQTGKSALRFASVPPWAARAAGPSVPIENNTYLRPFFDKNIQAKITLVQGLVDDVLGGTHDAPVKMVANTFPRAKLEGGNIILTSDTAGTLSGPPPQPDPFNGATADQIAAQHLGKGTFLPSLSMMMRTLGGGASRGWQAFSYKSSTQPIPPDMDPRSIFDRLFAGFDPTATAQERARRQAYKKSVLDSVGEQAKQLSNRLGRSDKQKMDEYLSSVQDLERRVRAGSGQPGMPRPGVRSSYANPDQLQGVMQELIFQAFITDRTRVITFGTTFPRDFLKHRAASQAALDYTKYRQFSGQRIFWSSHSASHYDSTNDAPEGMSVAAVRASKREALEIMTHWQLEHFATLMAKLDSQIDIDGNKVLDNTVAIFGGDNGESQAHGPGSIPCILAGRGGLEGASWRIRSGRQIKFFQTARTWKDLLWGVMNILGVPDPGGGARLLNFGYAKNPLDLDLA